ncbi:glutamate receptor ionotropic NMDA 2B [Biomphalaria glabrata]
MFSNLKGQISSFFRSTAEIGPQYTEDRTIDVYLDDSPLLQYGLVKNDKDCRIRFAGKGFGADGYAFGLSRHSWLKIPMSNEIMKYTQSEKFHELGKKYLSRPQCEHFLSGTANPYGLEHTGGLFIILSSAILIAVLFLILEHLAYHFVVPWLRKQPAESFWKTENLAFISQRVFRVVRSERLYSQKQAAQEMISIVRQRDFTRIIQKNELQKRRATAQRRVKSKAEVFQEITANIVSYHRQLQSASETADNSEAEIDFEGLQDYGDEGLQDYGDEGSRSDLDGATSGVNNDAYDATDSSDAAMNRFHLRRASSVSNDMTRVSSDEAVFQRDSGHFQDVSDNNVGRKVSSRSLGYGIASDFSPRFRKRSDSYFVFPSVSKCKERTMSDANNRASGHIEQRQVHKQTDLDKKKDSILKLSTDHSELMDAHIMTTPPPDSKGSVYYNSPSSSSGRSPSEENREFSPLPSLTSPSIDDFPDCRELSGSFSPLPPNSSPSLMSADPDFPANNEPGIASELAHSNKAANVSPEPAQLKDSPTKIGLHSFNKLPRREPRNNELPRSASVDSVPLSLVSVPNNDILVSSFTPSEPEENRAAAEISKLPNVKPEAQGNCNKKKIPAKPLRKFSSGHSPENTGQCQVSKNNKKKPIFDNQGRDYFQRNLKLKDNRVKSTLRQHAMSGYQSHLPADLIDDCTLEALSKEDVLILWRKSEIDLESRLQEVLAKNRRLSLAIDYLTRQEFSGEPEEV